VNIFGCHVLKPVVVDPRLGVGSVVQELVNFTSGHVSKIYRHKAIVTSGGRSVQDTVSVLAETVTKVLVCRDRLQGDYLVLVFIEVDVYSSQSKQILNEPQL